MTDATVTWTEERVERLKQLWAEGRSASAIASELGGVSRNAVIGKVHRLGLSGRGKPQAQAAAAPAPARPKGRGAPAAPSVPPIPAPAASKAATSAAVALAVEEPLPALAPVARPVSEVVIPLTERVGIMELRESMCRWPIGDPSSPDFRFCGAKARTGLPYCDCHAQIAYQPSAERRRERERDRRLTA